MRNWCWWVTHCLQFRALMPQNAPKSCFGCRKSALKSALPVHGISRVAHPSFIGLENFAVLGKSSRIRFKALGGGGWLVGSSEAKKTRQRASNGLQMAFCVSSLSAFSVFSRRSSRFGPKRVLMISALQSPGVVREVKVVCGITEGQHRYMRAERM
jgi:hypothetical protein